jgi:hypothetical protein
MNKKTRKEMIEKLVKEAELQTAIDQADEQTAADQNEISGESYGKKFTEALIDSVKIPGLED